MSKDFFPAIPPRDPRVSIGRVAEDIVCEFFEEKGMRLVARNFRWRRGELDLIFEERGARPTLVFIEVRSASEASYFLRFSISGKKVAALTRSIACFRRRHRQYAKHAVRFDLCWVEPGQLEHWPNIILG